MKKALMLRPSRAVAFVALLLLAAPLGLTLQGCTDLGEETFGIVTPDEFYNTDEEILAGLAPLYSPLIAGNFQILWSYHNLSQVSSDETLVPTRGSDWFDNGRWLAMHRHTWDPALVDLNEAWVHAFTGVARANGLLQILTETTGNEALIAEAKTLRAFYYFVLMDLFGNIPIVGDDEFTVDPENLPPTETRETVFNFIVAELEAARNDLPASRSSSNRGRVTRGVADAMLATMFLNGGVFRNSTNGINATGPNPCPPADCQAAIAAADRVINSGEYSLTANWKDNFKIDNQDSPEFIFFVQHLNNPAGLGLTFQQRALHYNQSTPDPWNGFSTLADVFNAFDDEDLRKDIFLVGQAFNQITGEPANDRQGNPLVFTPDINNIEDATEGEGIRILKWPVDPSNDGGNHTNDYAFWRLAEMYLIKAEALNELNGPTQEVIDLLNLVRARVYDPDQPLSLGDFASKEAMRDRIMLERLHELTYEAKRRQDLIRAGKFTQPWEFKLEFGNELVLFSIPQPQLDANPNLVQNPGY